MKQLVIVRHAKAVPYGYEDDFSRKLKDRGKLDALLLSSKLIEYKVLPDLIFSSPAKRALKTAKIYADNLNFPKKEIQKIENLYDGVTTSDFVDFLQGLPDDAQTVFVFGHNPTVHYLTDNLLKYFGGDMPTCSTVGIDFKVDSWKHVNSREGEIAFHLRPRDYR